MNNVIENIFTRRSIRAFRGNQIPEEDLKGEEHETMITTQVKTEDAEQLGFLF